jgi:hypothetical protein
MKDYPNRTDEITKTENLARGIYNGPKLSSKEMDEEIRECLNLIPKEDYYLNSKL